MHDDPLAHLRRDERNAAMLQQVRPADARPPAVADRYQLVVVGGGTAGLVTAIGAAATGARVALVERGLLGGDCLVSGCVPSKSLVAAGDAAARLREGWPGAAAADVVIDGAAVLDEIRRVRSVIAHHDSLQRLRDADVDVLFEHARFTGSHVLQAGPHTLRFARAVICTGSRTHVPDIPGLDDVPLLTTETLWELDDLPSSLIVLGGGPVGVEIGQALVRLGVQVTLVEQASRVLPAELPEAAAVVQGRLSADGVQLLLGVPAVGAKCEGGQVTLELSGRRRLQADALFLASGREAVTNGMGLKAAGVEVRDGRVHVDHRLRTTNKHIYAAGDVAPGPQFTHAAEAMARVVVYNALIGPVASARRLVVPRCTFGRPELAHVGPDVSELHARSGLRVLRESLDDNDRALTDRRSDGFVQVWLDRRGRVVAATAVGEGAGELINTVSILITRRMRLTSILRVIMVYPTRSEVLRRLADQVLLGSFSPRLLRLLRWFLRLRLGPAAAARQISR